MAAAAEKQTLASFVAQGLIGGIRSASDRGDFGAGFLAAGMGALIGSSTGMRSSGSPREIVAGAIASAVIGGGLSVLGGGKFANGAITGAFAYLATGIGQGAAESTAPSNQFAGPGAPGDQRAFVGGFFDRWTDGPAWTEYQQYVMGGGSAEYFTWDEYSRLGSWIDANPSATVVAHSWGGDTAATVIANGHSVANLVTVDPVGWLRPSYAAVMQNAGSWVSINATGGSSWERSNIIAGLGGAWNNSPAPYARVVTAPYNHASLGAMCAYTMAC